MQSDINIIIVIITIHIIIIILIIIIIIIIIIITIIIIIFNIIIIIIITIIIIIYNIIVIIIWLLLPILYLTFVSQLSSQSHRQGFPVNSYEISSSFLHIKNTHIYNYFLLSYSFYEFKGDYYIDIINICVSLFYWMNESPW